MIGEDWRRNHEGFDVVVPAGQGGSSWDMSVGWDPATPRCSTTSNFEPFAYAAYGGPPGIF